MRRALLLAGRGAGQTSPNPMVGASVVRSDGTIVGDGWHRRAGEAHAEVYALEAAGPRARGATLICTLEPCSHQGRTGPCVERIVAAGISEVVAATPDPNPLVDGAGFRYLRDHGIRVTVGVGAAAARRLNAPFFTRMRAGRPYVVMKAGVSLDGYVAAAPGVRTDLSGPDARQHAQRLRAEVDAIVVGSETVLVDDPLLTVRDVWRPRPVIRIVLDRRLRMPRNARLLTTLDQGPVWVVTGPAALGTARAQALEEAGVEVVAAPGGFAGAARALIARGVTSMLLEGGTAVHGAAWEAGMIDRVVLYVAPRALGGGVPLLPDAPLLIGSIHCSRVWQCGSDVVVDGHVHRID